MALIPARLAATRFPGKLLKNIGDRSVIRHTYENTKNTLLFDEVIVVTDSEQIFNEITHYGGYAVMSIGNFESGSDRIADAVKNFDVDIVVNVQGDEPFVKKTTLQNLLNAFNDPEVEIASLMYEIKTDEEIRNPNHVKVVVDHLNNALYFSRSVIPFKRNIQSEIPYFKHIGIYAFKKQLLMSFASWNKSALEDTEMLEQLRYLEMGYKIRMVATDEALVSIDTPEDLLKAERYYFSNIYRR